MQSSTWIPSENSNTFPTNTSNFWSNRKRKISGNEFEEKCQSKIFVTEEILIKNMQTLSLDLSVDSNFQEDEDENETNSVSQKETRFEFHKLLKDNLRNNDLQDNLINKLCDLERKKLCLQIVPYMPIHPSQLTTNNHIIMEEKEQENETKISPPIVINEIKKDNDDHLFKRPFLPTPYTVEEPSENTNKRASRMKRSYSQSVRSNSNLLVVELKNDTDDHSIQHSQSDYFIVEPTTPIVESSTIQPNSSLSSTRQSIQIIEYFDFSSSSLRHSHSSKPLKEDNMQSIVSSDIADKMDDEI